MSIQDVDDLSVGELAELTEAMRIISNQEFLTEANVAMWPHVDSKKRSQMTSNLKNSTRIKGEEPAVSMGDLAKQMGLVK